jgi:preprotein translocase subunit SecG
MWSTAFTILHIIACIFLVVVVLLQTGKGTDVNAVFGGSSQTIFGSSGAGNFLTRLTTATAAVFMATSLYLTYGAARQTTKSVFDAEPPPPTATTPATPEQPPAAPSSSGTPSDKPAEAPAASQPAPAPAPSASVAPTAAPAETVTAPTVETKPAEGTTKTPAPAPATSDAPK